MVDQRATFLSTARGKLISSLAVIAVVLGIIAEGISIYRNLVDPPAKASAASIEPDHAKRRFLRMILLSAVSIKPTGELS